MDKRVLANSIDNYQLAGVTHDVVSQRWDNWDLTEFLAYLVDTCASTALPYLAEQFNCDGLRGFTVANTEDEQRELIKTSIRLHKYMGTPWVIREACRTVGLPDIVLTEGIPSIPPNPATDWARFSLLIDVPDGSSIDFSLFNGLRGFINTYKPERCHLDALGVSLSFDETDNVMREIETGNGEREIFHVEISTEPVIYFDVLVDDSGDYLIDDNNDCITDFID